jgi:thiamine kinase-like enzyme
MYHSFLNKHLKINYKVSEINHGANNQVYLVETDKQRFILKRYSLISHGAKDKMRREFNFLTHLNSINCAQVSKPIALSEELGLLLMTCHSGNHIHLPSQDDVFSAFSFIEDINKDYKKNSLEEAKDNIETLSDFIRLIQERLDFFYLQKNLYPPYKEFIQNNIEPEFTKVCRELKAFDLQSSLLPIGASPSDFGFHNILLNDATLYFYDFEYAGEDSLWKLTTDFFAQPQITVPIESILSLKKIPMFQFIFEHSTLFKFAYHLTRLKWCFIIGGVFSLETSERRRFAGADIDFMRKMNMLRSYHQDTHFQNIKLNNILKG